VPPEIGLLRATRISAQYYGPLVHAGKRIEGPLAPTLRALYAGAVRHQDAQLGRLIDVLRERLGLERTLLVVTSDHGENLGEGGRYDHVFALNERLLHVPLLVRHPPRFPAGLRVGGLCQLLDVPFTIAEAAGAGASLAPDPSARTLEPGRFVPRDLVFAEGDPYLSHLDAMSRETGFAFDVGRFTALLRSASDGRHKLVWSSRGGSSLYDLGADADEQRDVQGEAPDRAATLATALQSWLSATPRYAGPPPAGPEAPLSPAQRERLRSLGYLR
jgi:arylsulfatase A-like enzyme